MKLLPWRRSKKKRTTLNACLSMSFKILVSALINCLVWSKKLLFWSKTYFKPDLYILMNVFTKTLSPEQWINKSINISYRGTGIFSLNTHTLLISRIIKINHFLLLKQNFYNLHANSYHYHFPWSLEKHSCCTGAWLNKEIRDY